MTEIEKMGTAPVTGRLLFVLPRSGGGQVRAVATDDRVYVGIREANPAVPEYPWGPWRSVVRSRRLPEDADPETVAVDLILKHVQGAA